MVVLLRHDRTGHYYRGNREWAMAKADATDFGSLEKAVEVVAADRLDGMTVVVSHERSGPEQVFDLSPGKPLANPRPAEG